MKAIMPLLDETSKKPYYLQIYDYIKDSILRGEITEGEKLPSLRALARSVGVSVTTVEQCYNQLLVEGYIYSRAQSGYYVSNVFSHSRRAAESRDSILSVQTFSADEAMRVAPVPFIYDPDCFDFNKWKKSMNKVITEHSPVLFFEGDPQGEEVLRTEIAKYLYLSRGVSCSPEQIIIGAGTQQITNHLATILRKMGIENVAMENPGYAPVRNIFRDRGFAITPVKVSDTGILIEKLPANIRTAAYVSPSNNVFTGSVMPVGRRFELLNWAAENDSYIIEDDYDSELRYFGRPVPALKSLEDSDHVIYLGSFSSTLFAAVKISYMVLPEEMAALFSSMAGDYSQTCSKLEQLTLALFMETGSYQTHIKKLRKLYSQKLLAVTETFERHASDFIEVKNTSSGINILLRVKEQRDVEALKKDADDLGIPVVIYEKDLMFFYYNQIPLQRIPSLLRTLIQAWRKAD